MEFDAAAEQNGGGLQLSDERKISQLKEGSTKWKRHFIFTENI